MNKTKIVPGIIFILSISFNVAFIIHLATARSSAGAGQIELDLSEQQKKLLEPVRMEMHRENESIKKQISRCQEKLLAALKNEPVDKNTINQCIENISGLQKQIQENTIEEIIRVKKYMNPDQCNCLIDGMGAALNQNAPPCNCPHCRSHKK